MAGWSHRAAYMVRVVWYEEAAPWTEEGFAGTADLRPCVVPACQAEPGEGGAGLRYPRSGRGKRRRFQAYLRNCQPSWPSMPPSGAGVFVLNVARFGVWGLAMEPQDAAEVIQESDWNKALPRRQR